MNSTVAATPQNLIGVSSVSLLSAGKVVDNGDGEINSVGTFSPDGTQILFVSESSTFSTSDTNGVEDIYVKNLSSGVITLISANATGVVGNSNSASPSFSPDGSKVAFYSYANNLVPGDTNNQPDVFVKTISTGAIVRISTDASGNEGNSFSVGLPVFSPDGTKVAFTSTASNLVAGDTNGVYDVFIKTLATGAIIRVSTDASDTQANSFSTNPVFSPDGTMIGFTSASNNLVPGDTNTQNDVFVKTLSTGAIIRVSTDSSGNESDGNSDSISFSPDSTRVLFTSQATNLVASDTNGVQDVFVKMLSNGAITRVSTDSMGTEGDALSRYPVFSPDGTKVAFSTDASNFDFSDWNYAEDVYLKDLNTGSIALVSSSSGGLAVISGGHLPSFSPDGTKISFVTSSPDFLSSANYMGETLMIKTLSTGAIAFASTGFPPEIPAPANGNIDSAVMSPDGTQIAFSSEASNIVSGDNNLSYDIFLRNISTGAVTRISTSSAEVEADSISLNPIFSPDGTKVAFWSMATNLVAGDTNGTADIFIKNLSSGAITRVSTDGSGGEVNGSSYAPSFSPDGNQIVFQSTATNLVAGDTNGVTDLFVKDLLSGAVTRISTDSSGAQVNGASQSPHFSPDGTKIVFYSVASNLVPGDTNASSDIFVKTIATGAVIRASTNSAGIQGNNDSYMPIFSPDGTKVAFISSSTNLVNGTLGSTQVFLKEMNTGEVTLLSADASGTPGTSSSGGGIFRISFSPDGTKVAFASESNNLVPGDSNLSDIFVKTIATGKIVRISENSASIAGDSHSYDPIFDPNGLRVLFLSYASNLETSGAASVSALNIYLSNLLFE